MSDFIDFCHHNCDASIFFFVHLSLVHYKLKQNYYA